LVALGAAVRPDRRPGAAAAALVGVVLGDERRRLGRPTIARSGHLGRLVALFDRLASAERIAVGSRARRGQAPPDREDRRGPVERRHQPRQVPIFSGCSKRELAIIARASKEVSHKEGTVIAREGERGVGLFLILEGQCVVTIGGKTKAKLGPGDFFGEVALLDGGPRTATVMAFSPVDLIGITGWVFRGLLMEHPSIALKTLVAVAGRLRSVSKEPV
jgi:hypothetical protein